jgi:prepilin-type N-terminal cleavage/methylation domain-containing protein
MSKRRSGFTAIELLISISVILVLVGMAVPAIAPSIRRGRVNEAANAITQISRQARMLAIQRQPEESHYGVLVADDPALGPGPIVALIYGHPQDGKKDDIERIVRDARGEPVALQRFTSAVSVWTADGALRDQSDKFVSWWYKFGSGIPIAVVGGKFTLGPATVGTPKIALSNVWGIGGNDHDVAAVAASRPGEPGLSLRSADNRTRCAVAVYVSGYAVTKEY